MPVRIKGRVKEEWAGVTDGSVVISEGGFRTDGIVLTTNNVEMLRMLSCLRVGKYMSFDEAEVIEFLKMDPEDSKDVALAS